MNYILVVRDWSNDVHKEHFEGGVRYLVFKVFVEKIYNLSILYIHRSVEKFFDISFIKMHSYFSFHFYVK